MHGSSIRFSFLKLEGDEYLWTSFAELNLINPEAARIEQTLKHLAKHNKKGEEVQRREQEGTQDEDRGDDNDDARRKFRRTDGGRRARRSMNALAISDNARDEQYGAKAGAA